MIEFWIWLAGREVKVVSSVCLCMSMLKSVLVETWGKKDWQEAWKAYMVIVETAKKADVTGQWMCKNFMYTSGWVLSNSKCVYVMNMDAGVWYDE